MAKVRENSFRRDRRGRRDPTTAAKRIALSIANSPLVKTAVAGEDANWGRVVMAVGKAGEAADRDRVAIWFGPIRVAAEGLRDPAYDEAATTAYMRGQDIDIRVDIGLGLGRAIVWTCDLTQTLCRNQRRLPLLIPRRRRPTGGALCSWSRRWF